MRAETEGAYTEYVSARLPGLQRAAYLLCGGDRHRADEIAQTYVQAVNLRKPQTTGVPAGYAADQHVMIPG